MHFRALLCQDQLTWNIVCVLSAFMHATLSLSVSGCVPVSSLITEMSPWSVLSMSWKPCRILSGILSELLKRREESELWFYVVQVQGKGLSALVNHSRLHLPFHYSAGLICSIYFPLSVYLLNHPSVSNKGVNSYNPRFWHFLSDRALHLSKLVVLLKHHVRFFWNSEFF